MVFIRDAYKVGAIDIDGYVLVCPSVIDLHIRQLIFVKQLRT